METFIDWKIQRPDVDLARAFRGALLLVATVTVTGCPDGDDGDDIGQTSISQATETGETETGETETGGEGCDDPNSVLEVTQYLYPDDFSEATPMDPNGSLEVAGQVDSNSGETRIWVRKGDGSPLDQGRFYRVRRTYPDGEPCGPNSEENMFLGVVSQGQPEGVQEFEFPPFSDNWGVKTTHVYCVTADDPAGGEDLFSPEGVAIKNKGPCPSL